MADEPRRSGRATKGQHTKNETPEPSEKKVKGRKKGSKKSEEEEPETEQGLEDEGEDEEEEAIIRCVCGYVVENPRDKRAMICCDKCEAWQHNVHMGLSEDDDDLPDTYYCEQCKPEDHEELLEAIARGEKIWEVREANAKAAKAASRKKGKGGRKSAAADREAVPNITDPSNTTSSGPAAETKHEAGQKRKLPAETSTGSPVAESGANKIRKVSAPKSAGRQQSNSNTNNMGRRDSQAASTTLQTELVENIEDLHDKSRRGAASGLLKIFSEAASEAIRTGSFKLPVGQDLNSFTLPLALNVEYALYMNLWSRSAAAPQTDYGTQCRSIMHNVKKNPELRDKIFSNQVSPMGLSKMSSEDMASQELQKKTAEWKKQAEKQSILPSASEQGAMIRRTHKGEELIEPVGSGVDTTSARHVIRRRSNDRQDSGDRMDEDRSGSPGGVELPADTNRPKPSPDIRNLFIDTKRTPSSGQLSGRKSSTTFDVDKVWSSVESPVTPARPTISQPRRPAPSNTNVDPEVDRLLQDENDDDDEYEPADFTPDPDTVWAGSLLMPTVADLRVTAKYAAGINLSQEYPWNQLMPSLLVIEGRIDVERAETYLCGLQYSKTKDLTVVSLTPADHQEDRDSFDKLFEYFTSRKRYGVIRKSGIDQARDIYVIPLETGTGNWPAFLELLLENLIEQPRKQRMLLVVYVINCTTEAGPSTHAATTTSAASNTQAHGAQLPQRTPSISQQMSPVGQASNPPPPQYSNIPPNPYAHSPSAPPQHFVPPSQPSPAYPPQYQMPQPNGNGGGSLTGMAAAIHILGDMANSRSVSQLLASSPNTGVNEFGHIKDVFLADPNTRNDLELLMPRLKLKISGQS